MKFIKEEKGAAGLEFTIVFPLLLMVTFGIIEFGSLIFDKAILTNAAREGVRAGIVYNYSGSTVPATCPDLVPIQNNVEAVVNNYLQSFLINFGPNAVETVLVEVPPPPLANEYTLRVRVNYRFQFIFIDSIINLLFNGALSNGLLIDAVAEMRGEDQTLLFELQGC